jgi:alkylhydroperoxidase/carboxymuconolactone decarboxylase family protein YurZ
MAKKKAKAAKKPDRKSLQAEIDRYRETYVKTFGAMPPSPGNRFDFSAKVNPEYLVRLEALRGHAMYSDVFDDKLSQMILFAVMLGEHNFDGAAAHAAAARRYGASWEELHKVVELAATSVVVWRSNRGTNMLKAIRDREKAG